MRLLKVSDTRIINLDRVIDIRYHTPNSTTEAELTLDYVIDGCGICLYGEIAERVFGMLEMDAREPPTLALLADYRNHKEPEF